MHPAGVDNARKNDPTCTHGSGDQIVGRATIRSTSATKSTSKTAALEAIPVVRIGRQVLASREVDDRQPVAGVWHHSVRYDTIELEEFVPDVVRKSWGHRRRRELRPSGRPRALRHLDLHVTLGIVRRQLAAPGTSTSGHSTTSVVDIRNGT